MNTPFKAPKLLGEDSVVTKENFPEAIQQAIGIEIATIPVYLFTYYSVIRTPNEDKLKKQIYDKLVSSGKNYTQAELDNYVKELNADIQVFANKTGALIMSVAIEEMLHMSLSSNVMQAIVGNPKHVGQAPNSWPAYLPGHDPEFPINRSKLSLRTMYTFLQIESPFSIKPVEGDPDVNSFKALNYTTIGEFYYQLERYVCGLSDSDFNTKRPQLVPGKGFYTPNTVDTIYYDRTHHAKLENAGDSGGLIYVTDSKSAIKAMEEIVEQGEGYSDDPRDPCAAVAEPEPQQQEEDKGLNPNGTVKCTPVSPDNTDNPQHTEASHYEKFNEIFCEYHVMKNKFAELMGVAPDLNPEYMDANLQGYFNPQDCKDFDSPAEQLFQSFFVADIPTNPTTMDYDTEAARAVSDFTNAIYSFLYIMTENCYKREGNTQYEIFMFGVHKTMIFILNSICGELTSLTYQKDGKTYSCSPTFEEYEFNTYSSPKSQVVRAYEDAVKLYPGMSYMGQRVYDLPDVPMDPYNTPDKPVTF